MRSGCRPPRPAGPWKRWHSTYATEEFYSSSTTASTCWTAVPSSSTRCCGPARISRCLPRADNPCESPARPYFESHHSPSRRRGPSIARPSICWLPAPLRYFRVRSWTQPNGRPPRSFVDGWRASPWPSSWRLFVSRRCPSSRSSIGSTTDSGFLGKVNELPRYIEGPYEPHWTGAMR